MRHGPWKKNPITLERLRELVSYDPETGVFRRRFAMRDGTIVDGQETGWFVKHFNCYCMKVDGKVYRAHHLAWLMIYGAWPERQPVPIDGDMHNLRIANWKYWEPEKPVELTLQRLHAALHYDPSSGAFTAKEKLTAHVEAGQDAVRVDPADGYSYVRLDKTDYLAQRLAWFYVHGAWPKRIVLQDKNKQNLRFDNLADGVYLNQRYDRTTKEGAAAYGRDWRSLHAEKLRDKRYRETFGIDLERYQAMLIAQKGVCAICDQPETNVYKGRVRALSVDHCHTTARVRDLLCYRCNSLLGQANDSIEVLRAAISYLERHTLPEDGTVIPLKGKS